MDNAVKGIVSLITFVLVILGIVTAYNIIVKGRKEGQGNLEDAIDEAVTGKGKRRGGKGGGVITEEQIAEQKYLGDQGKVIRKIVGNLNLVLVSQGEEKIPMTSIFNQAVADACDLLLGTDNCSLQDVRDLSVSAKEAIAQEAGVDVSQINDQGGVMNSAVAEQEAEAEASGTEQKDPVAKGTGGQGGRGGRGRNVRNA